MPKKSYPPIVHYLPPGEGGPSRIACGKAAGFGRYATNLRGVTCYECARMAVGLTTEQRIEVWDQANERCSGARRCPWSREGSHAA